MPADSDQPLPDGGRTSPREGPQVPPADTDESSTQVVDHGLAWIPRHPDSPAIPGPATTTEVLETGVPPAPRRRFGVAGLVGGVALALIAAGGIYAYTLLSGGGTQPEQYVPADAIAFVKVDLDPPARQKIAVMRYFGHFPGAADVFGDEDDIRKILFELAQEDNDTLSTLDYDEDIEPWIGDRLGVAVMSPEGGGEPDVVIVLQVSDQEKAADGLDRLLPAAEDGAPGVVFTEGYALLAEDEEIAERARQSAADASLADDERFRDDMAAFGDGVGAFWLDLDGIADVAAGLDPTAAQSPGLQGYFDQVYTGRLAGVVSFDDDYVDLTMRAVGSSGIGMPTATGQPVAPLLETVPGDTLVALAYSGLDDSIEASWGDLIAAIGSQPGGADIEAAIARLEREFGIVLPDDLLTLLGSQTLFVVAGDTFRGGTPTIAYRAETDAAAADEVMMLIKDLVEAQGGDFPVVWRTDGSTLLAGTSSADLSALQSGTGIADPTAETALPNLEGAHQAVWIDVDRLSEIMAEETGAAADQTLSHIAGIGVTATAADDGSWTATLRVVAD